MDFSWVEVCDTRKPREKNDWSGVWECGQVWATGGEGGTEMNEQLETSQLRYRPHILNESAVST